jgi:hypothetical protein
MSEMDLHENVPVEAVEDSELPATTSEDPEAPEADAVEQRTEVAVSSGAPSPTVPDEVNPADHVEQQHEVGLDEDDYR